MAAILEHSDWLNGRVPDEVRLQIRQLVEVVGYLPCRQPLGVITADAVLLAANQPLLDILGAAAGNELLDSDWDDIMPGWSERSSGPGEHPRLRVFEDFVMRRDGEPLWAHVVASPVFTPGMGGEADDALAAWTLFINDATPEADDEGTRRSGEILALLLESRTEWVVQLDHDGHMVFLSPSLRRALGVGERALGGRSLDAAHARASARGLERQFHELMEELMRPPFQAGREMTMPSPAGERIIEWEFESLLADGGELKSILGVGRDVTDRRRAESERERSELRLRTLVETTSQIVWMTGPGDAVDRPLDAWAAFTGQSAEDTLGDGWADAIHPDDRERVLTEWKAAVGERRPFESEHRLRNAAGEYRWMSSRAVPLPEDDAGGYYGVVQDITGRKVAEEGVRRRLDLEMMMSVVSSRFANATLESTAAAIDFALAEVGHHVGADRIQLYSLGSDGTTVVAVRCWSRDGDRLEDCEPLPGFAGLDWLRTRLAAGESVALRTADDLPLEATAERAVYEALGFGTVVAAPIIPDGRLSGFLVLDVDADRGGGAEAGDRRWDDDDLSILRLFADQLAGLLLWHEDEQNLRSISESFLAFGADVGENLTEVCRAAARIAGADLVVYDRRRGGSLEVETGWHLPDDLPRATTVESCVCGDLLAEPDERVRVISGLQSSVHPRTCPLAEGHDLRTLASLPVSVGGRVVALLCCLFTGDATLRDSQLELLRVLGRVAAVEEERRRAIEDRVLGLAQLEQAMERTVGTLSGAMSTRDPYTAGHERRVAQLAVAIAGELGMADEERRLLGLAATVHDIGKISVPSEILSKPTRLGEAELAIIQTHAEAGWRLLEPAGLPASVTDAVLQHHERLDGSGYPAGLKGDAIGEFARILAVADVVEAMSSHRPYRPTLGIDAALEEIESGRGTRYDAGAVDACLRLFREQGFRLEE